MREDVEKIIAERPKGGRTWASKTPRPTRVELDGEGEQIDESSNHVRRKRQKGRSRQFNVLERFLLHRVGRPWSKVYAEVCAVADARRYQGVEVREYLKSFVATECWLNGKTIMSHDWYGCPSQVRGLYVHPKSGLLLRNDI
jgi:hypothetical protein